MAAPILEFNYDISCPFAYIASTRIQTLAKRCDADLQYRPVLLGAIYRSTSAPQGAGGSASDVFNATKRAVGVQSMARTLKRYNIQYNPPPQHPRKTVNALRLLYCVPDGDERRTLTERLFRAYWVEGRDVSNDAVLIEIARESGIAAATALNMESFKNADARKQLESATADAIERGAFGVPGFWIPEAIWKDFTGEHRKGRFFWGQDRMHFVEATLLSLSNSHRWANVDNLESLMPRSMSSNKLRSRVRLEFWYDFSSPWAFLGYTQIARLQRMSGPDLQIVMKPFLLGILFREIGAPNMPMNAVSPTKALWSRQDHADWTRYWNTVNEQEGRPDAQIDFHWADVFPIRTPTVLRVAIAEPRTVSLLYSACWERNENVGDESVLSDVLIRGGFNGPDLIANANAPAIKTKLRELTAKAKALGVCGVPTFRVLHNNGAGEWVPRGGLIWGQDEMGVVEDLIAGWDPEMSDAVAEPRKVTPGVRKATAQL